MSDATRGPFVVAGAGSIGCFVGGLLADAGREVTLLARPRIIADIAAHGLHLTSIEGLDRPRAAAGRPRDRRSGRAGACRLHPCRGQEHGHGGDGRPDRAARAAGCDDRQPAERRRQCAAAARAPAAVTRCWRAWSRSTSWRWAGGRYHRATSGEIVLEQDAADTAAQARTCRGLRSKSSGNMPGVQWGKLLLNLNNAINALSGLPLRDQLSQRAWRAILAEQIAEALRATKAAGIAPVTSPLPAPLLPFVLRLPDAVFRVLAARMLKIDPQARSSMWEDLQQRPADRDRLPAGRDRQACSAARAARAAVRAHRQPGQGRRKRRSRARRGLQPAQIASDAIATEQLHNGARPARICGTLAATWSANFSMIAFMRICGCRTAVASAGLT